MYQLLSLEAAENGAGASVPVTHDSRLNAVCSAMFLRTLCFSAFVCIALLSYSFAQSPFPTSRGDNSRVGANTSETMLTPANVNKGGFGRLFSFPLDYMALAQPLYMPNVNINGQGPHNVVYVATMADTVYAIDADSGAQLWSASMLDGGVTASGKNTYLPCGYGGFTQEGILGTPAIDTTSNTMYLVAKTVRDGLVRHDLHALDITTGNEQPGSPVQITATTTSNRGHVTVFNSLHQKNRPGLLLLNGQVYIGFGSNGCNDSNSGWVLSYDATSLAQLGVFNTSPDYGLTSIWQSGVGLTSDEAGNIFAETAETGANGYDVPSGGETYCNSILKLSPTLSLADYFTPWIVAFLNSSDLDLSSTGTIALPDQDGPFPHELIAGGKQGFIYVLNRDSMGMFSTNDSQVIQEFPLFPGEGKNANRKVLFGSPAYWNHTVYFAPNASPLLAYPVSGGLFGTPVKSAAQYAGAHSPSVSANGTSNGIVWVISGTAMLAFDAVSLKLLYTTNQAAGGRDTLPALPHFVTQTVANGKVYVATQTTVEAYGLFQVVNVTGGGNQSAPANTALPVPVQVQAANPYSGQGDAGVTINFSDGCKKAGAVTCGSFNPTSAVTDSNGYASSIYTVPQKVGTYTLTFSGTSFGSTTTTATALSTAQAVKIIAYGGTKQTGPAGSNIAKPLIAQAQDAFKNPIAGVTVNFTANKGGIPNPASVVTDSMGLARTTLQLPTTVDTVTVTATSGTFKKITFLAYSVAGPASSMSVVGGDNQFAAAGTQLPRALTVSVVDQYGNPVSGVDVAFDDGGAGGSFSNPNPVVASATGTATQSYTLPPIAGAVTINVNVTGVADPVAFHEIAQ